MEENEGEVSSLIFFFGFLDVIYFIGFYREIVVEVLFYRWRDLGFRIVRDFFDFI